MTSSIIPVVVLPVIVAAVLHITGKRAVGCWLLAIFPASACAAALYDLSLGSTRIGLAAFESDQKQLVFCVLLLALTLFAALRPRWPWLFWIAWMPNLCVCAVLVYLAFFWKVFS